MTAELIEFPRCDECPRPGHFHGKACWVFQALREDDEPDETTMGNEEYPDMNAALTFDALRLANLSRLPLFRNSKGEPAHSKPDGSDWSPAQWLQAVTGELGEYANIRKKFERGDIDLETFKREAAKELADVQTYLDILAHSVGVDLGRATVEKWNAVSERVGCPLRIRNGVVENTRPYNEEELAIILGTTKPSGILGRIEPLKPEDRARLETVDPRSELERAGFDGDHEVAPSGRAVRPVVQWFAEQMEERLAANDHKPGWRGDDMDALLSRLADEKVELAQAVEADAPAREIAKEAADVANFALMIADNALAEVERNGQKLARQLYEVGGTPEFIPWSSLPDHDQNRYRKMAAHAMNTLGGQS